MFLLIYKCGIAVSVRGKWFWKAWHCKLSLSDRLSAPADQKMPQSMMSDRQANSPGGQTLLPHSKRRNVWNYVSVERWLWLGRVEVGEVGGVSPLGAISQWVKPLWMAEENVVIIQGEHQRAFTLDLFQEWVQDGLWMSLGWVILHLWSGFALRAQQLCPESGRSKDN